MAYWLPYHQDRHYERLAATIWGQYQRRFVPRDEEDAEAEAGQSNVTILREAARISDRHARAVARYREKKLEGR